MIQVGSQTFKLSDEGDAKKGRHHHVEAALGALSYTPFGDDDDEGVCVRGLDINNVPYSKLVSKGEDVRAAAYMVADRVVTADAEILNRRKTTES